MPIQKPVSTDGVRWATDGGATKVDLSAGKKSIGWILNDFVPSSFLNFIWDANYKWFQFLNDPKGTGAAAAFDAVGDTGPAFKGTGGTNKPGFEGIGTGTSPGVTGASGSTETTKGGVHGTAGPTNNGIGVSGVGSQGNDGIGVLGTIAPGGSNTGVGVKGIGGTAGIGVVGEGGTPGTGAGNTGVKGTGSAAADSAAPGGHGGIFTGGISHTTGTSGDGIQATGAAGGGSVGTVAGHGVVAVGGANTASASTSGQSGGKFTGGAGGATSDGAFGVEGYGVRKRSGVFGKSGSVTSATGLGAGVEGLADPATGNHGVSGLAGGTGAGVKGQSSGSGPAVEGIATTGTGLGGKFLGGDLAYGIDVTGGGGAGNQKAAGNFLGKNANGATNFTGGDGINATAGVSQGTAKAAIGGVFVGGNTDTGGSDIPNDGKAGAGAKGTGGNAGANNLDGGAGFEGYGGTRTGTGNGGPGLFGQGSQFGPGCKALGGADASPLVLSINASTPAWNEVGSMWFNSSDDKLYFRFAGGTKSVLLT